MVATTVFDTNFKFILSDNATPANGTWAVYLNPKPIVQSWRLRAVEGTEFSGPADVNTETKAGIIEVIYTLTCDLQTTQTHWENFKAALVDWNEDDSLIYVSNTIGSWNEAKWPAYSTHTQTQITVKIDSVSVQEIQSIDASTNGHFKFMIVLKRVKSWV